MGATCSPCSASQSATDSQPSDANMEPKPQSRRLNSNGPVLSTSYQRKENRDNIKSSQNAGVGTSSADEAKAKNFHSNSDDRNKNTNVMAPMSNSGSSGVLPLEERKVVTQNKPQTLQKRSSDNLKKTVNANKHVSEIESTPPPPFINFKNAEKAENKKREEKVVIQGMIGKNNNKNEKNEDEWIETDQNDVYHHNRNSSGESELDDKTPHFSTDAYHDAPNEIIYGDESVIVSYVSEPDHSKTITMSRMSDDETSPFVDDY